MSKAAELANLIGNINAGGGGVNRNAIINGSMNVAQRQSSSTGVGANSGYYVCDRWRIATNTSGRATLSQDSSAPSGFANSYKFACTTADTSIDSAEQFKLEQRIEGQNVQMFAKGTSDAKPFAVSFYVKGNASATYVCELFDEDNSRQCSKLFNVTTDWTRVELTFPADTTGTFDDDNARSLTFGIFLHAGSDRTSGTLNSSGLASSTNANRAAGISSFFDSTDRTFFLTGVQLEVGQTPTEFEHEPFERTLLKCQRYFQKIESPGSTANYNAFPYTGLSRTSTIGKVSLGWITQLRASPTITTTAADTFAIVNGSASAIACTSVSAGRTNSNSAVIEFTVSSGLTVGQATYLTTNNATDPAISVDSEL